MVGPGARHRRRPGSAPVRPRRRGRRCPARCSRPRPPRSWRRWPPTAGGRGQRAARQPQAGTPDGQGGAVVERAATSRARSCSVDVTLRRDRSGGRRLGHVLEPPVWLDWNLADRRRGPPPSPTSVTWWTASACRTCGSWPPRSTATRSTTTPWPAGSCPTRGSSCWSATAGWPMPPTAVEAAVRALPRGGDGFLADLERPPATSRPMSWSARLADLTRRWDLPVDRDALGR